MLNLKNRVLLPWGEGHPEAVLHVCRGGGIYLILVCTLVPGTKIHG